jgi:peptidoglycan/LPS O-acetylase OafA/YrhL
MMLLPLAALAALWAIRRGWSPVRAWALPVGFAAALALSAWVAVETGERDEERAENVVGEQTLDAHKTLATRFLYLSSGVLVVMAIGLMGGAPGRAARAIGSVAALGLILAGFQVGHSGGRIVYGEGATVGLVGPAGATGDGEGGNAARSNPESEDD